MIEKNDPRLTDFVLGELDARDSELISGAIENSAELRQVVAEIEQTTQLLGQAFESEPPLRLSDQQRKALLEAADQNVVTCATPTAASGLFANRWILSSVAAALVCLIGGVLYFSDLFDPGNVAMTESAKDSAPSRTVGTRGLEPKNGELKKGKEKSEIARKPGKSDSETDAEISESMKFDQPKPTVAMKKSDTLTDDKTQQNRMLRQLKPRKNLDASVKKNDQIPTKALLAQKSEGGLPEQQDKSRQQSTGRVLDTADLMDRKLDSIGEIAESKIEVQAQPRLSTNPNMGYSLTLAQVSQRQQDLFVSRWQSMLDQSKLAPLKMQVKAKSIDSVQALRLPQQRFVRRKEIYLDPSKDGTTSQKDYDVLTPRNVYEPQPLPVRFLQPVATLDDQEADKIVEKLASKIDPDGKKQLTLEGLLGFDDSLVQVDRNIDLTEELAELAAVTKPSSLESGRFSLPEPENADLDEVATHELFNVLRLQLGQYTIDQAEFADLQDESQSLNDQSAGIQSKVDRSRIAGGGGFGGGGSNLNLTERPKEESVSEKENHGGSADTTKLQESEVPKESVASGAKPKTREMHTEEKSDLKYAAPVILQPLGQSVKEFDYTAVFAKLKTSLQKRNNRLQKTKSIAEPATSKN